MSELYNTIPPERELDYLNDAAQAANDAEARFADIQGDLLVKDAEETTRNFSGPSVVAAAEAITKQDDLSQHYMDAMDSARLGVPGLAMTGHATAEQIATYANGQIENGADPSVVEEQAKRLQTVGGKLPTDRAKGRLTYKQLVDHGNELIEAGFDPDHATRILQKIAVGPTKVVPDIVDKPPRDFDLNS